MIALAGRPRQRASGGGVGPPSRTGGGRVADTAGAISACRVDSRPGLANDRLCGGASPPAADAEERDMSTEIDLDLVRHIGRLSRIELSEDEVRTFKDQLTAILTYVAKLGELDTDGVEPMAHALELANVFGADELGESLAPDVALANAPQRDGDFFKVPKVIGDS